MWVDAIDLGKVTSFTFAESVDKIILQYFKHTSFITDIAREIFLGVMPVMDRGSFQATYPQLMPHADSTEWCWVLSFVSTI